MNNQNFEIKIGREDRNRRAKVQKPVKIKSKKLSFENASGRKPYIPPKARLKREPDVNFRISFIFTLLFLAFSCAFYFYEEKKLYTSEYLLNKAVESYKDSKYFDAAKYYSKVVARGEGDADVFEKYGLSLMKLSNYDLTVEAFKNLLELMPGNADAYCNAGTAYYRRGLRDKNPEDFKAAEENLARAIELNPKMTQAYLMMGYCYQAAGENQKAVDWYQKTLTVKDIPKSDFYILIGRVFEGENKFDEALSYYKQADTAAAFCAIGDVYFLKLDDIDAAVANYKKAVVTNPREEEAYVKLGDVYLDRKRYGEAAQWYLQALKIYPDDKYANYALGLSYKKLGDQRSAAEYLEKAATRGSDEAVAELRDMGVF